MALALNEIASPQNNYGWASAGIYCFSDTKTNEILYIGLTVDLAQRFRQHNGLTTALDSNCKTKQIKEWFKAHKNIGYSILVQSSWIQPLNARYRNKHSIMKNDPIEDLTPESGQEAIIRVEGLMLEAHLKAKGKLPKWNKIGGSVIGTQKATAKHMYVLDLFTDTISDYSVAESTIRAISENPIYERYENYIHGVRLKTTLANKPFQLMWENEEDIRDLKEQIVESKYSSQIS